MSKKKIDHEYHAGKDKMTIKIKGYSPGKKTRAAIVQSVIDELESSPDRPNKKSKRLPHNPQKRSRLEEVGD
jgi:hypothetical protein